MALSGFTDNMRPIFEPLNCDNSECNQTIRGSVFTKMNPDTKTQTSLCEDCYRARHYGNRSYVKRYKHCAFTDVGVIDAQTSRALCTCRTVAHVDKDGEPRALFPTDSREGHDPKSCGLLRLKEHLAKAKYDAIHKDRIGLPKTSDTKKFFNLGPKKRKKEEKYADDDDWLDDLEDETSVSMLSSTIAVSDEDEVDGDIPFYLRRYTKKYHFGNVHMALRVGPLTIENGVPK